MNKKSPEKNKLHNKITRWIIFIILGVLVIYLGIGGYAASTVTQVGDHIQYDKDPGSYGLDYKDVRFSARGDDIEIAAWFIPNKGTDKAVILVHGRDASKQNAISGNLPKLGVDIHESGFAVLMIDLRAHGDSEGARYSFGVYERRDVLGAVDWLIDQGFSPGQIGVLGISLGGGATIGATAEEKAVGALVVDSTFADLNPLIQLKWEDESGLPMFFLPGVFLMNQIMYGYDMQDVKPVNEIVDIAPRPILILHCTTDKEVDVSHAEQLKDVVPHTETVFFDSCDHAELYRDFPQEYKDAVIPFFQEILN